MRESGSQKSTGTILAGGVTSSIRLSSARLGFSKAQVARLIMKSCISAITTTPPISLAIVMATATPALAVKKCVALPTPNAGVIELPVYQLLPTYDRYFKFIVNNMALHYYVQYARELVSKYAKTGDIKFIDCLASELLSYSLIDPFSKFVVTNKNAQSIIEIDNTLRSLAYIYNTHKALIPKRVSSRIDLFFIKKANQLTVYFNGNKHAKLYESWHDLTKSVVGMTTGQLSMQKDGFKNFDQLLNDLLHSMETTNYDGKGYMASHYKATINILVAMAELSTKNLYADGRLHDAVNKLLELDHASNSELFIIFPTELAEASKMPKEILGEISDNVFRLRYKFDHKTNMAWLGIYKKKYPTSLILDAYKKYSIELLEEHVGYKKLEE